ncbi:MAG: rod shape-determining protein MreD [Chloroflexia bacterium]|nr:rod shape-determining protein MreD [Chloroflexia bacterium]
MLQTGILALIVFALLQASLLPRLPLLYIRLDLVLLLVLGWAMLRGLREGAIMAFAGGIALDLLSSLPLGSHALLLLLVILPLGALGRPFFQETLTLPVLGALFATLLYYLLLLLLLSLLGQNPPWGQILWRMALPQALAQAALMPLIYWLLRQVDRRVHRRFRIG